MVWLGALNWFTAGIWFILTLGAFLAENVSQAVIYSFLAVVNLVAGFLVLRKTTSATQTPTKPETPEYATAGR